MLKRVMFLVLLISILLALVFIKDHTADPVNGSSESEYTMVEYKITDIKDNYYYGKSENGTEIRFSNKNILSGDKIQINDEVICYFEKNNLGEGLVKVEKK